MSVPTAKSSTADQDRLRALLAARRADRPSQVGVAGPVRLNAAQRGIWFEAQLRPESPAYLVPVLLRLRGALDRGALMASLRELAERHQVLRSVIDDAGPHPVQVLRPAEDVPLDIVELGSSPDPDTELDRRVRAEARKPFALDRECPLRATCFVLGEQDHALLLVLHHIATDARSNELLVNDLAALYSARLGRRPAPPAPPQYAAQQPARDPARHLDWWQERLDGYAGGLELPSSRAPGSAATDAGAAVPLVFPAELAARLPVLAKESGATTFMVLLAAWQALLARISGSHDIAVGVPDGGRHVPGSEGAVGLFVNTVVIRGDLSGDPTGRQLLEQVRTTVLDSLDHAEAPFGQVVERVRAQRATGGGPLFDTMANLYRRPDPAGLFPGLTTGFAEVGTGSVKAELALQCFEDGAGGSLSGVLQFRTGRFTEDDARRIADWYLRLLDGLLTEPERPIDTLPLAEPGAGLVRGPVRDYPLEILLPALVRNWAETTGDAVAVISADGSLSYAELDRRANRIAHRLLAAGVRAESPVAVLAERNLDLVVALLGVMKAGAAFVPLEPSYPDRRLAGTLTAAGAEFVLVERDLGDRALGRPVTIIDEAALDPAVPATPPAVRIRPDQLAYVIFTSGSTGTPKGVAVEHRSLAHYVHAALERIHGHGRSFALLSTAAADLGYLSLFGALAGGGTLHLIERERATDPDRLAEYFATHPVDVVKMVPSHLELLAAHGELAAVLPRHTLVLAGEACSWQLAARVRTARPGLAVHNHYGPTETTVSVLGCELGQAGEPSGRDGEVVPLGTPFANAVCYVVDPAGRPLPPTIPGELLIAGPGVARGYLGDAAATERSFGVDPVEGTQRCYRSGDRVVVRADGLIEFLGRIDDQVKIRGYRVEPGEVAAACRALPGVRDAVVLAVGEAHQRRLAAWLVPSAGLPVDLAAARAALRSALPGHMVPSALLAVPEIPLTPNGKVDRAALPQPGADDQAVPRTTPRTATERRVAAVWQQILELPDTELDIDEDFFALGGDSFRALRAAREIDPALRVITLFTHPTVRELAALLDRPTEPDSRLLQRLAGPPEGAVPSLTVLCVPYGGGSAAAYRPLAEQLTARLPGTEVLGIELPGHDPARPDETMLTIPELVAGCRAELAGRPPTTLLVYGHCVGTAAAVALAQELEDSGERLAGVVLGGSFPTARLPGRLSALVQRWLPSDRRVSDRVYRETLQAMGGQLEEDTESAMIRAVRHDVRQSTEWFGSRLHSPEAIRLRAPVLCVVGDRDRTTELAEERYREWTAFAERVELARIEGAGHYFPKHQSAELAGLIGDLLSGSATAEPPAVADPIANRREDRRELRRFVLFATGQTASMTGSAITAFGLGVWVYQRTHEIGYYSLITMLALLPALLAAPIGGAVTDRFDRRRVLLACAGVYGITLAGLITGAVTGQLQVWEVAVFAGLTSLTSAFQRPAYLASVAQLVPKPYLAQANGITQLGIAISTLLAPVFGGALITTAGLTGVIFVDLAAMLAGAAVLVTIRFPDRLFRRRRETFASSITGGWRFIIRRGPMVAMVLFFVVVNYLTATTTVLTTPLVLATGSAAVLGVVLAAGGLGAVAGGLAMALWGGTRRRADGMIATTIVMGLATALIGLRPTPLLMAIGLFLWSGCNAVLNAHWLAILQAKVGLELQGRVVATNQMLATAMMPLGYLLTPLLYENTFGPLLESSPPLQWLVGGSGPGRGMGLLMLAGGLLMSVWGLLGLRYRPLRRIEDRLPDITAGQVITADLDALQREADALHDQAAAGTRHR